MKNLGTLGNTLLFIGSVLFVILFQIFFGVENGLIGISIVMASLTMVRKDLTHAPFKNGVKLILLNIIIGVSSILALNYFWLGVVLSFLIFFFLGYYMLYRLSKPLYVPFALEYLYLYLTPIPPRMIPLRILALTFGSLVILLVNYLYHRKDKIKDEDNLIIGLCNTIKAKCKLILEGESYAKLDTIFDKSILKVKTIIYDKKEDSFFLTTEETLTLSMINSLENLNYLLPSLNKLEEDRYVLKEISSFLSSIESGIKTKKLFELKDTLEKIKLREDSKSNYSEAILKTISLLNFIYETMVALLQLKVQSKNPCNSLTDNNSRLTLDNKKFPILSFKFYFSLRLACGMALATLLSGFFIFNEGIWVLVTTFAIMVPLYGTSVKGVRYEVIGTLVGGLISCVLFGIFKGFGAGGLVILLASYFYGIFTKEYEYSGVLTSICAFGIGFIVYDSINILSPTIIFLIVAGAVIAMIFESLLFPYNFNKAKSDLYKIYTNTLTELLQEVHNLAIGEKHSSVIYSLLAFSNLLEERMLFNNENLHSDQDVKFVKDQRTLFNTIYELYLWIDNMNLSIKVKSTLNKFINILINEEVIPEDEIKKASQNPDLVKTLEDKVALNTLNQISNLIFSLKS